MSDRKSLLRTPSVANAPSGADVTGFAREVSQCPLLSGRLVDVTFAGVSIEQARHGLGRRYQGAFVVGLNASHSGNIGALTPASAAANSVDPATHVAVVTDTSFTGTVRLWVF